MLAVSDACTSPTHPAATMMTLDDEWRQVNLLKWKQASTTSMAANGAVPRTPLHHRQFGRRGPPCCCLAVYNPQTSSNGTTSNGTAVSAVQSMAMPAGTGGCNLLPSLSSPPPPRYLTPCPQQLAQLQQAQQQPQTQPQHQAVVNNYHAQQHQQQQHQVPPNVNAPVSTLLPPELRLSDDDIFDHSQSHGCFRRAIPR